MALHFACQFGAINCIRYLLSTEEGCALVNVYDDVLHHVELTRDIKKAKFSRLIEKESKGWFVKSHNAHRVPLHTVVSILPKGDKIITNLSKIVPLLIDAGACVNLKDSMHHTPLNNLMDQVRILTSREEDISLEDRHAIVESTRLLLEAGADSNKPDYRSYLNDLLMGMSCWTCPGKFSHFLSYLFANKEALPLVADLVCLLLKYGAETLSNIYVPSYHLIILKFAGVLVKVMTETKLRIAYRATIDRGNEMMGVLCNMLRCFLLAGKERINAINSSNSFIATYASNRSSSAFVKDEFKSLFTEILFKSGSSASTRRLVRLVISVLNASELNEFREDMNRKLQSDIAAEETSQEFIADARKAIQLIDGIEGPRFLQHLARRAVIKALTHKCLLNSTSFKIPQHLNEYVLLRD